MNYSDKPWLKSYKLGPYKLAPSLAPYPQAPVHQALDEAAERYPGQTAIQFLDRSINYRQLKSRADKLAAALAGMGVTRGDRVNVFLPNCPEFIISDWAILKVGAAIVPTSILRTDEGLIHEAGSSGSKVIICRREALDRILAIQERTEIEHIVVVATQEADSRTKLPPGVHDFRKTLAESDPEPPPGKDRWRPRTMRSSFHRRRYRRTQRGHDQPC